MLVFSFRVILEHQVLLFLTKDVIYLTGIQPCVRCKRRPEMLEVLRKSIPNVIELH